jgi:hypothetical protein
MTLRGMEFIADVMLFKDGIEKLNVIAFCGREAMSELFGLRFFPSTLLLCCADRDMYQETSKYWSSKARVWWLWTARITWWHGGSERVFISQHEALQRQIRPNNFFFLDSVDL